ncbi:succinate--hydroxymethylglutarate CoA-transferase-like [Mytilus californianus]|uniref:succinate--hydroxymethylglutarate CoA-transferase-like n=1 Tax=Mytilus californianus TaxID=6549 RepID=UPI002246E727|nr:succinate--hydroxymethylglutarate CoA-transferase-like [Mytilus californianus]
MQRIFKSILTSRTSLKQLKKNHCPYCTEAQKCNLPLDGLKILDISRILAGPYCTMILGDLGAEIIKVEKPGAGDDTRSWGPPFCGKESVYFLTVNRNKKSIAIDIRTKDGQDLIQKLAKQCDVMVENYIPGKLDQYNLGYKHLNVIAPQLIYCSITGYGQTGPYSKRAGYDVIVSGVGGLMHITGPEDGDPCKVGVAMTDLSTGLYAHGAILAAVLQRQITGRGQHIDCNLFSTQVASLINIGSNYLNAGMEAKRHGTAHQSIVPYQAFKTKDSYIVVGAGNDKQFHKLCKVLQLDHLLEDNKYTTNKLRVHNRKSLLSTLDNLFITKKTKEWLDVFDGCGIPYGPVNNMENVFIDPQTLHNEMILEMDHSIAGKVRVPGQAVKYSDKQMKSTLPPPTLGQHTNEILENMLNLSETDIKILRDKKVIQ